MVRTQTVWGRRYTDDFKTQAVVLAESIGRAKAPEHLSIPVRSPELARRFTSGLPDQLAQPQARGPLDARGMTVVALRQAQNDRGGF